MSSIEIIQLSSMYISVSSSIVIPLLMIIIGLKQSSMSTYNITLNIHFSKEDRQSEMKDLVNAVSTLITAIKSDNDVTKTIVNKIVDESEENDPDHEVDSDEDDSCDNEEFNDSIIPSDDNNDDFINYMRDHDDIDDGFIDYVKNHIAYSLGIISDHDDEDNEDDIPELIIEVDEPSIKIIEEDDESNVKSNQDNHEDIASNDHHCDNIDKSTEDNNKNIILSESLLRALNPTELLLPIRIQHINEEDDISNTKNTLRLIESKIKEYEEEENQFTIINREDDMTRTIIDEDSSIEEI